MKKLLLIAVAILTLALCACANGNNENADGGNSEDDNRIEFLDSENWPSNKYTKGLPVPDGKVVQAMIDNESDNCSIVLSEVDEEAYNGYIDTLKQEGFSVVDEVTEEIEGQDYSALGIVLSNDKKGLSISYTPGNMVIYISFEK